MTGYSEFDIGTAYFQPESARRGGAVEEAEVRGRVRAQGHAQVQAAHAQAVGQREKIITRKNNNTKVVKIFMFYMSP